MAAKTQIATAATSNPNHPTRFQNIQQSYPAPTVTDRARPTNNAGQGLASRHGEGV